MFGALGIVFPLVISCFALIPSITMSPATFNGYLDTVFGILDGIFYFLPSDTVFAIFTIIMALQIFRVVVAFLKTVWAVLPIV